ncbi:MAG: PH domain-containing protein [Pirellulaceae bacterium]
MTKPAKHTTSPTVYESAIDWWILALLLITPILSAVIGIYAIWIGRPGDSTWLFLTGAITALVTAAFAVPCRYTILEDALSIRCGLLFYQVPFESIQDVSLSSTWASGPALSLKRVKVQTEKRTHIISPKFREDFVRELRKAIKQS